MARKQNTTDPQVWARYDHAREMMGDGPLLDALLKAMSTEEATQNIEFIERVYELTEGVEENPLPKAYDPQEGYRYQILCRNQSSGGREWEQCDYAKDRADKKHLLENYRDAYGAGWEFKTIMLPEKYWPKTAPTARAPNPGYATAGALVGRLKF